MRRPNRNNIVNNSSYKNNDEILQKYNMMKNEKIKYEKQSNNSNQILNNLKTKNDELSNKYNELQNQYEQKSK